MLRHDACILSIYVILNIKAIQKLNLSISFDDNLASEDVRLFFYSNKIRFAVD